MFSDTPSRRTSTPHTLYGIYPSVVQNQEPGQTTKSKDKKKHGVSG